MSNKRQQLFLVEDLIKWLQAQDPSAAVYAISVRDGRGGSRVSIEPYHPATSHNPIKPDVLLGTWEEVDNLDS